jgi:hypothetical protein
MPRVDYLEDPKYAKPDESCCGLTWNGPKTAEKGELRDDVFSRLMNRHRVTLHPIARVSTMTYTVKKHANEMPPAGVYMWTRQSTCCVAGLMIYTIREDKDATNLPPM